MRKEATVVPYFNFSKGVNKKWKSAEFCAHHRQNFYLVFVGTLISSNGLESFRNISDWESLLIVVNSTIIIIIKKYYRSFFSLNFCIIWLRFLKIYYTNIWPIKVFRKYLANKFSLGIG